MDYHPQADLFFFVSLQVLPIETSDYYVKVYDYVVVFCCTSL